MNDKRARNRLAAGAPSPARVRRRPGVLAPADPCRRAAHAAVSARRRMLAWLTSSGWPRDLVRRVLTLYPARPVNPAWAAARDAFVEHHLLLPLWRCLLDRRYVGTGGNALSGGAGFSLRGPSPAESSSSERDPSPHAAARSDTLNLPAQAEARATTYSPAKPPSALLRLAAGLLLALGLARPAWPVPAATGTVQGAGTLSLAERTGLGRCLAPASPIRQENGVWSVAARPLDEPEPGRIIMMTPKQPKPEPTSRATRKPWQRIAAGVTMGAGILGMGAAMMPNVHATDFPTSYSNNLYFVNHPGMQTEFVLVGADETQPVQPQFLDTVGAYDGEGNLLATNLWWDLPNGKLLNGQSVSFTIPSLFPALDPSLVSLIRVNSTQSREGVALYKSTDGLRAAAGMAMKAPQSTLIFPHIAGIKDQWNTHLLVGKAAADDAKTYLQFQNYTFPEFSLDGLVNPFGVTAPNLGVPNSGAVLDMVSFFGGWQNWPDGVLPAGTEWARVVSEKRVDSLVTPYKSLVGVNIFDSPQLGVMDAFSAQRPAYEWTLAHVAHDMSTAGIWWTGIVATNDNPRDARIKIKCFDDFGVQVAELDKTILAYGKLIGMADQLELPAQTAYVTMRASEPVSVGELFGNGPNLGFPVMVGVDAIQQHNWSFIDLKNGAQFDDPLTYLFPLLQARQPGLTPGDTGRYAGLAFYNEQPFDHTLLLEFQSAAGLIVGQHEISVPHQNRWVRSLEDVCNEAGLSSVIDQIDHVKGGKRVPGTA